MDLDNILVGKLLGNIWLQELVEWSCEPRSLFCPRNSWVSRPLLTSYIVWSRLHNFLHHTNLYKIHNFTPCLHRLLRVILGLNTTFVPIILVLVRFSPCTFKMCSFNYYSFRFMYFQNIYFCISVYLKNTILVSASSFLFHLFNLNF